MPEVPEDKRQFYNSEFARRLGTINNSEVNVIVQIKDGAADSVVSELQSLPDVEVDRKRIIRGKYIPATVPVDVVDEVAGLDAVVKVHHDQPSGVLNQRSAMDVVRDFSLQDDPVRNAVSSHIKEVLAPTDDLRHTVQIDSIEAPRLNFIQTPLGDPFRVGTSVVQRATGSKVSGFDFIPTGESVSWMRDGSALDGYDGSGMKLAVIDTGHTPLQPSDGFRIPYLKSLVPGEPPADGHSHGSWCTYVAVGKPTRSVWGEVGGVAPDASYAHFKALNTFPGFGRTSWIMKAIEEANEWGADVINLSLGGPAQGPVEEDPYCQLIDELCKENLGEDEGSIFVVAAGNAGPDRWTIGTPGMSPKAITVGSWSLTDSEPSVFSSRGPQSEWYKDNPERYEEDLSRYGSDEFVKPDVVAPGGGRANQELTDELDELLHSVSLGWMEGFYDGVKDARGSMKGTSMASPHVAGLVGLLFGAGIIKNAREVKQVVRDRADIPDFELAPETASQTESGKNVSVGFGRLRESLFDV